MAVVWRPFGGYIVRSTTGPPQPSEMSTQYGGKAKGRQDVLNVTSFSGCIYQIPQTTGSFENTSEGKVVGPNANDGKVAGTHMDDGN